MSLAFPGEPPGPGDGQVLGTPVCLVWWPRGRCPTASSMPMLSTASAPTVLRESHFMGGETEAEGGCHSSQATTYATGSQSGSRIRCPCCAASSGGVCNDFPGSFWELRGHALGERPRTKKSTAPLAPCGPLVTPRGRCSSQRPRSYSEPAPCGLRGPQIQRPMEAGGWNRPRSSCLVTLMPVTVLVPAGEPSPEGPQRTL